MANATFLGRCCIFGRRNYILVINVMFLAVNVMFSVEGITFVVEQFLAI